jgi:predicted RNA-binding Zn ribbon-like protein
VGGALCLDFVNTRDAWFPRPGERPPDYIADYASLVAWSRRARALDDTQAAELPAGAPRALADAHRLRDAIHAVLAAASAGRRPPAAAASRLQARAAEAIVHGELAGAPGPLAWRWAEPLPHAMLWPVALSAVDLLTSEELGRLKQCPGQDGRCGWMFLDRTKNRGRRWCSMRLCGNPVKARRQNARRRAAL